MTNSNLVLLAEENGEYGVANILSLFFNGIKKGFDNQNISCTWVNESKASNSQTSLSFNVSGLEYWKEILERDFHHIMWSVDSCFYQNFHIIKDYLHYPNFHLFITEKSDPEALNYFFPEFKNYHYIPPATDYNLWKYKNEEKDLDIVYIASVRDPEEIIKEVKQTLPPNLFEDFMQMFEFLQDNPHYNVWHLYKELFLNINDNVDPQKHNYLFNYLFRNLTNVLSFTKRIQMIKNMEDIGVKIWGNDIWAKYISGKNEYMGFLRTENSIEILHRAKISLNLQSLQILNTINERILNSILSESAVLCDAAPEIKKTFGDNLMYYDVKNFTNIKQKALSLLKNKDLREYKVQKAKEIVLKDHTWDSRAKSILEIINDFQK